MRILDTVECQNETMCAFPTRQKIIQFGIALVVYNCNYSLMGPAASQAIELIPREKAYGNTMFACEIDHCLQSLVVPLTCDFQVIERAAARAQRLGD